MGDGRELLHPLSDLDELHGAGGRMPLDLAPLGPPVGLVVVVYMHQQQASLGTMDDEPNVGIDPNRPEIRVFGPVELVEGQAWRRGSI